MPVHVIWKGACLNWSLLSVWIQGEAHPHSTFICLFQNIKDTGLCGKWKEVSRRHHHQFYCKGRQVWVLFVSSGDKLTSLLNKEPIISSTFISTEKVSGTTMGTWWGLEMMCLCVRVHFPGKSSVCSDATAHVNFIFESVKVPLQV